MTASEDTVIPVMGGSVILARAMKFTGQNRDTGAPEEVDLPNRVVVTQGRKKSTLNGAQCRFIAEVYADNAEFRAWCDEC